MSHTEEITKGRRMPATFFYALTASTLQLNSPYHFQIYTGKVMPYITQDRRTPIAQGDKPANAGELNYVISKIIDEYLVEKGVRYANLNEVIGVLECAKLEAYRRLAAPYEDTKIEESGDVYECLK